MHPGKIYHIYNHANGRENLFLENKNYDFFLRKLEEHILPVCRLFSYYCMPNHFHLLAGVKQEEELQKAYQPENSKIIFSQTQLEQKVSKSFSNLFSSYTQSFNKVYQRKGSLFMPSMKEQLVETDDSFCKVSHYLHVNPVHHGFVLKPELWAYSSYNSILSNRPTLLERDYVLEIFGGIEAFKKYHEQEVDRKFKLIDE